MQDYFRSQAIGSNKRNRTRGLLIDSAISVFGDKGIAEASIHEITAIAGLANGTFYNHFKDKDELAFAASEAIALEIARHMDEQMHDLQRGVTRVVVATSAMLRFALALPNWAQVLVEQYQRRPTVKAAAFSYMRADIELAVERGEISIEVDRLLLEQIAALMMTALRRMLEGGDQQELLGRTCDSILRLLGMTPAQAGREVARATTHPLLQDAALLSVRARSSGG
ncbi:MAG: TetR/AcrR family transcriptional regulator [Pseudomonadota bacterium]